MLKRFLGSKKRRVAVAVISAVLIVSLVGFWQTSEVAEAAILDPHPGLVGWWRFDEGTGTIAEDSSGNGNNGTIYGATWVEGKYGNALSFDGIDDYIGSIGSASFWQSLGNKTIIAWIYPSSFGVQQQILGNRKDSNSPPIGFGFGLTDVYGKLMTWTYPWQDVSSSFTVTLNAWNFVAMTHNGTTVTFYLNDQTETKTGQQQPSLGGGMLAVGQGGEAYPGERFSGIIDEVRIYNRTLSADEIGTLFQRGPDFSSMLLAKVPRGTTEFFVTLLWQGHGSIGVTIESPSTIYTEDTVPVYQKTTYASGGVSDILNNKRLAISVASLPSEENWYIFLEFDDVEKYRIAFEVQS